MNQPKLAYVEMSLPDGTQAEKFAAVRRWGIALEIANLGDIQIDVYKCAQIPITAVQAYQMHDFHPLHRNAEHRHQAKIHVEHTLEVADTIASVSSNVTSWAFPKCVWAT